MRDYFETLQVGLYWGRCDISPYSPQLDMKGGSMPFLNYPDGTVVIVPQFSHAWVCIVCTRDGSGALVPATNAEDLLDEAAAFLNSFGTADLDGGALRMCPPELAAKAVFLDDN